MGPISIGQPWVLCLLTLCVVLVVASWRNRLGASSVQNRLALAARIVAVALLVLALAETRVRWPTRKLAVALVTDTSRSVSPAEVAHIRASVPRDHIERDHVQWVDVASPQPAGAMDTDLESSIDEAVGMLPSDATRRILIATDGRATRGDTLAAADRARRAGVEVSVLPMGDRPPVDLLAVTGIDTPRLIRAGRNISVAVRLFTSRPCTVALELLRDGERLATRTVDAPAGASLHDLPAMFPDDGVHTLTLRASATGDAIADNNTWETLIRVVSPPRVLLVHELAGASPALADVYRDAHLRVDEVHAAQVPDDAHGLEPYQFIALDEIALTDLTESQQRAIRRWVEERGGGLLTTTGMHGVGTAPATLREIEPIQPPRSIPEPRPIELVLVVDRSGSMQGRNIVNAREAAIAAVRALRPDSRVGLVAFSGSADLIVPTGPMTESERVTHAVAGITARGGTNLAVALREAAHLVSSDPRYLHHVILLSDGDSQADTARQAAQELRNTGATVTAITIGPRASLMADIARIGHGHYVVTNNPGSLPELFVHEAQFRNPPPAREYAFRPTVNARMSFMDGVDPSGDDPIFGFVPAQARPGSLVLLSAPDGGPLLAHWSVGLGQVATLTTSTSSRWADAWRRDADFRRLFGQMAWEMMRANAENDLAIHVEPLRGHEGIERVSIVAPTIGQEVPPIVMVSRGRREGVRLQTRPAAPGVWTADVAREHGFVVDARMPSSQEPTVAAGIDHPYPEELTSVGSDAPMIAAIAAVGGGHVVDHEDAILSNVPLRAVSRDARLALLLGALLAYIAGVFALRLPWLAPVSARRVTEASRDNRAASQSDTDREAA